MQPEWKLRNNVHLWSIQISSNFTYPIGNNLKYVPLKKVHVYVNLENQIKVFWVVGEDPTLNYFPMSS